jgi:hypothetical protein
MVLNHIFMDDRTAEILNRFDESWIKTEAFYDNLINNYKGWERLIPVREFLADLDQSGGRRLYRLGTSIHWLIISRSVDHGLRSDQKFIRIDAINTNDFEVTMRDGEKLYRRYRVNQLKDARVSKLLQTLKSVLID